MNKQSSTIALPRTTTITALGVVGFAAALAAASQISIPVPGTPVPFTLQPFIVVLAGMWLGPRAGAASMALFLAAGAIGLPVFSPMGAPGIARFAGPTGGYLIAYPAAAWVAGVLAMRAHGSVRRFGAAFLGMLTIYVGGVAQLALLSGGLKAAVLLGVLPFIGFDVVKAAIAAAVTRSPAVPPRAD